jgi:hypothetical protein
VDNLSDNPAAKLTAQEILERVQRAQQPRGGTVMPPSGPTVGTRLTAAMAN